MLITCLGCGRQLYTEDLSDNKCPKCGDPLPDEDINLSEDFKQRLGFAHSLRRIGQFSNAKKEFNNLLAMNSKAGESSDANAINDAEYKAAALGYFLSLYEVTDYKYDKTTSSMEYCDCTSTSLSPVENSNFWRSAARANRKYEILCNAIEKSRLRNISIKQGIPKYHAAIVCDQQIAQDRIMSRSLYDILSEQADIFYAPVTLRDIAAEDREFYMYQALRNPDIVQLLFVVYTQPFDFQYMNRVYQADLVRQCEDFAKTHQKDELYSVILGNGAPTDDMNELSIKKLNCRVVDEGASKRIAGALIKIIAGHISDEKQEAMWKSEGRLAPLNASGYSPVISPDQGE
ncbi:MAG: hypothetical protein NC184_03840 [Roseburia sp.]|nr:hypothetical protein [Roseburia sp.]